MSVVAQVARPDAAVYDPDVERLPLAARFFMYLNNKCGKINKKRPGLTIRGAQLCQTLRRAEK